MPAFIDITGQRFGRLVVIERVKSRGWLCRCDCGGFTAAKIGQLNSGARKSCGCLRNELIVSRSYKHGHKGRNHQSATYAIWKGMITRCTNSHTRDWKFYGARGITVCERWHDFTNFLADMGERPEGLTIDRINNELGYSADNCRWATRSEQRLNRRPRRPGTYVNGEKTGHAKLTAEQVIAIRADQGKLQEIAEEYHVAFSTISKIKHRTTWKHIP